MGPSLVIDSTPLRPILLPLLVAIARGATLEAADGSPRGRGFERGAGTNKVPCGRGAAGGYGGYFRGTRMAQGSRAAESRLVEGYSGPVVALALLSLVDAFWLPPNARVSCPQVLENPGSFVRHVSRRDTRAGRSDKVPWIGGPPLVSSS